MMKALSEVVKKWLSECEINKTIPSKESLQLFIKINKLKKLKSLESPDENVGSIGDSLDSWILAMNTYKKKMKKLGYDGFHFAERMNGQYAEDGHYCVFYATGTESIEVYDQRMFESEQKSLKKQKGLVLPTQDFIFEPKDKGF